MGLLEGIDFWPDDWAASPSLTHGRTLQTFFPNIEKPTLGPLFARPAHVQLSMIPKVEIMREQCQ
jgi:hypothetical protein